MSRFARVTSRGNRPTEPAPKKRFFTPTPDFSDAMRLERWAPGTTTEVPDRTEGAEVFVLEGSLEHDSESYDPLSWLRFPVGEVHHLATREGCVLYIKTGALESLRSTG